MALAAERNAAKAANHTQYFTGRPCKYGHIAQRHTASGICAECHRLKAAARYRANPAAGRARVKRHNEANPQKLRRRKGHPEPTRPMPLVCECCGLKSKRTLVLDHDHVTGAFRGWLCHRCNLAIGILGDTIIAVGKALRYLRRAA